MPYSPTTWVNGTTAVSAANMNNIESGVSTLDTTCARLAGAAFTGTVTFSGSNPALQGSHSSGQPLISYGNGAPASLAANEIYIQLT